MSVCVREREREKDVETAVMHSHLYLCSKREECGGTMFTARRQQTV